MSSHENEENHLLADTHDAFDNLTDRQKKLLFVSCCSTQFFYSAVSSSIVTFYPIKGLEYGISQSISYYMISVLGLSSLVASLMYNFMIMKIPRKTLWIISIVGLGISTILLAESFTAVVFKESYYLLVSKLIFFFSLLSVFRVFSANISVGTIGKIYKQNAGPMIQSYQTWVGFGLTVGPVVISYLWAYTSFFFAFTIVALIYLIQMTFFFHYMPYIPLEKIKEQKQLKITEILSSKRSRSTAIITLFEYCVNRLMASSMGLYFFSYFNVSPTTIALLHVITSSSVIIIGFTNTYILKLFDPRSSIMIFGLVLPSIGCMMIGPFILDRYLEKNLWLTVFGFFILQFSQATAGPNANTDIINTLRENYGFEINTNIKDSVANLVTFLSIIAWFIGPMLGSLFLSFTSIGNGFGII